MLDRTTEDGQSILEMLGQMADMPLSEAARKLGYSTDGILFHTLSELDDPGSIRQKTETDCVWTNMRFALATTDPARFVQTSMILYRDGQAPLTGGGTIKLDEPTQAVDVGGTIGQLYYRNGALWLDYQGSKSMAVTDFLVKLVTDPQTASEFLAQNPRMDNPYIRAVFDSLRKNWDGTWKSEAGRVETARMIGIANVGLNLYPELDPTGGLRFLATHFESYLDPPQQLSAAPPSGVPLGRITDYLAGDLTGYQADEAGRVALDAALTRGATVPVAFATDDGESLHMTSIIGRSREGDYIVYDPESGDGPRTMPAEVLAERARAFFLRSTAGAGLAKVAPGDPREVGGGRLSWRGVAG